MGPGLIVGAAVLLDDDRRLVHGKERLLVETLIPEAAVKALAHPILPRLAGVNVGGGDALPPEPPLDPAGDEFRPIIEINFTPAPTTVDQLRSLAAPTQRPANARVAPVELTTYHIQAVLIGWKLEGDQDMHLVIADAGQPTRTMIAEVPSTTCDHVCSSGHTAAFRAARQALIAQFGTPTSTYHTFPTPRPITVTGVGFFDFLHGQTGVAPNGIELHPVLKVQF